MTANYRQIGGPDGLLANETPFTGNTMRAVVPAGRDRDGEYVAHIGEWSGYDARREAFDGHELRYVVYSYGTPIAAVTVDGDVIVPDVRYSVTTSRQQGLCRAWLGLANRSKQWWELQNAEPAPFDHVGAIIAYESGELDDSGVLELFSHLVRTNLAWSLQGHYGRTAAALINQGYLAKDGEILAEVAS